MKQHLLNLYENKFTRLANSALSVELVGYVVQLTRQGKIDIDLCFFLLEWKSVFRGCHLPLHNIRTFLL